jgi:hypothetical protein
VLAKVETQIQEGLAQHAVDHEQETDEKSPDPSIAVEE